MADEPQVDGVETTKDETAHDSPVEATGAAAAAGKKGWPTWAKATAIVTAVAVLVAGIGLVAGSHTSKQKAHAASISLSGTVDIIKPFTAKFVGQKLLGGGASVVGSAVFSSVLTAFGVSQADAETKEILDRVKQMQAQLTAISNQISGVSNQVTAVSNQIASFQSEFQSTAFETTDHDVRENVANVGIAYRYYNSLLCARAVELAKTGVDLGPSIANASKCPGRPRPVAGESAVDYYENQFVENMSANNVAGVQAKLHEWMLPPSGGASLLARMVKVRLGNRKYFTTKDSIAVRNYYEVVAESEALAAFLTAEDREMTGHPDWAADVLTDWQTARDEEQKMLPPLLPDGMLIVMPNGIGNYGPDQLTTNPQILVTQPDWLGVDAPAEAAPNNVSSSTAFDHAVARDQTTMAASALPIRDVIGQTTWKPFLVTEKWIDSGQYTVTGTANTIGWTRSVVPIGTLQVSDRCGETKDLSWPSRCTSAGFDAANASLAAVNNSFAWMSSLTKVPIPPVPLLPESDRPATRMEHAQNWGATAGWHLLNPTVATQVQSAVAGYSVEDPASFEHPSTTPSKLIDLATRGAAVPSGPGHRAANIDLAWTAGVQQSVWLDAPVVLGRTSKVQFHTAQGTTSIGPAMPGSQPMKYRIMPYKNGFTDPTTCNTIRQVPKQFFTFDATSPVKTAATVPLLSADQLSANRVSSLTDPKVVATPLERCAANAGTAVPSKAGALVYRNLTMQKGDDYTAQWGRVSNWPVIAPSPPQQVSAVAFGSTAKVSWLAPLSDGGTLAAGQPLSYRITVRSADGAFFNDCVAAPAAVGFAAECAGLPAGTTLTVKVTASTWFWTSSEAEAVVTVPLAPTTTVPSTTTAPSTTVPATTSSAPPTSAAATSSSVAAVTSTTVVSKVDPAR